MTTSHGNGVVELHSVDREFRMRVSSGINSQKDTIQSAWQQRLKEHGQSVTYKRIADGWFVVSGIEDGKTYYRKHFVSPGRAAEFLITYPKSRASVYDAWVRPIEKSFVAHRVSDSAQASSRTEAPSVVTSAPTVNETLELPSVIGRSYADAANILAEFKVQRVEVASAAPIGEVLAQDPAPGISLPPGSPIGLRVSDGSLASAAATVSAPPAASVAPAPQLEPSTAPVQNDRPTSAFDGDIATNVAAPVVGVLLGLLLGAVLMRRAHLARRPATDPAPAEHVDKAPSESDSSQTAPEVNKVAAVELPAEVNKVVAVELPAEVNKVAAVELPAEIKFIARLDPGDTTIEFIDLPEDEAAAIEQSRN
ncbi:MAG TPA: PASTA domain-containing protein [Burkholderiaceae bacterium]|nr:PASTA domain-containing protein [Burkholderiaceae bacterium]